MPSDNPETNNVSSNPIVSSEVENREVVSPNTESTAKGSGDASENVKVPRGPTAGSSLTQSAAALPPAVDDDDDDLEDETIIERIIGLSEMFPSWFRTGIFKMTHNTGSGVKWLYGFSRSATWVVFSSSTILLAPVIFEMERSQMDEMQKQQQRQILLGPGAASMGTPNLGMGPPPPPPPSR